VEVELVQEAAIVVQVAAKVAATVAKIARPVVPLVSGPLVKVVRPAPETKCG